jgi:hypothetical protein
MLLLMAAASGVFSSADVKMSLSDQEGYLGSRDGDQRDVVSGGGELRALAAMVSYFEHFRAAFQIH